MAASCRPCGDTGAWRLKAQELRPSAIRCLVHPSAQLTDTFWESQGMGFGEDGATWKFQNNRSGGTSAFLGDKDQTFQFRRKIEWRG